MELSRRHALALLAALMASEGFSNPLVGGSGGLVYPSIHSPNFVSGVSGWTIRKDGSAEFDNVIIRGNLIIGTTSQGVFIYSGTPANGNPPVFCAVVPGTTTDPFGNALPLVGGSNPIVDILTASGARLGIDVFADLVLHAASGAELWLIPSHPSQELYNSSGNLIDSMSADAHGNIQRGITAYNAADVTNWARLLEGALNLKASTEFQAYSQTETAPGDTIFVSGKATSLDTTLTLGLLSALAAGSAAGCFIVGGNSVFTSAIMEIHGALNMTGAIKAIVAGSEENWHLMSALPYFNNGTGTWADGAQAPGKYRMEAAPANSVSMAGSLAVPAGFAVGQQICTLPAAYRPLAGHTQLILGRDTSSATPTIVLFSVGSGGQFQYQGGNGSAVAAGDNLVFEGRIYLDL